MKPDGFDAKRFVDSLYLSLLGRPADPTGLQDKLARLRTGQVAPGDLIAECLNAPEFADHAPAFLHRYGVADRRGLFNDVTQYGELQLLLRSWLDRTAVARFVVDVGARGRERSNSYDLCRWFGWRALLIEANPALIAPLADDFAGLDVQIAGCAVSDYEGRAALTLGVNDDVSSLQPEAARAWGETRGEVEVEVRRLSPLLTAHGVPPRFDLLSLDIEGEDVRVLNDLVADGCFTPDWVFIEASFDFATTRLDQVGASRAATEAYEIAGATRANLLLRRRGAPA